MNTMSEIRGDGTPKPRRSQVKKSRQSPAPSFAIMTLRHTKRSKLIRQAARNRSGPISPCSKGAAKMPAGRRAKSRARLVLCTDK